MSEIINDVTEDHLIASKEFGDGTDIYKAEPLNEDDLDDKIAALENDCAKLIHTVEYLITKYFGTTAKEEIEKLWDQKTNLKSPAYDPNDYNNPLNPRSPLYRG